MRIGIIGGGVPGLGAAWMLADRHDVTVFEKDERFGGHAHTVEVDAEGEQVFVDAGFEFFSDSLWPTFCRLLGALKVDVRPYDARLAVFRKGSPTAFVLPPTSRDLRAMGVTTAARRAFDLGQFAMALASASRMMRTRDTSRTVAELLDRLPLTPSFRNEFLFPYLLAGWCVEPEEFREFSAYDVLSYTFANLSWRGSLPIKEVVGGTRSYVNALLREVPAATVRASSAIDRLERAASGWRVHQASGAEHAFDHVVVAANARDTRRLLRDVPGTEGIREQLGRIDYFQTTIAVHGDRRLMPADERDWSIVNVRHDGRHAQTTIWKPWRSKATVLRSWITYDERPPERAYRIVEFEHPRVTPAYFEVQRALAERRERDGLFLAGVHTHDIDSHESALVSAVKVVERLDPGAPRLAVLQESADRVAERSGEP